MEVLATMFVAIVLVFTAASALGLVALTLLDALAERKAQAGLKPRALRKAAFAWLYLPRIQITWHRPSGAVATESEAA